MKIGLTLSSEEHPPRRLVELGVLAEEHEFDFVSISDHYHPWIPEQGHAPFVWSVLGAVATRTNTIELGVGVSCPTVRIHPAIVAQAAATTACLAEGRLVFGVGSGEALNEHITGERWPPADIRQDMLEEAIEVLRALWTGDTVNHHGRYYTVEDARLFDLPEQPIPLLVSAFGPASAKLAARVGDGLWTTGPSGEVVQQFEQNGGHGAKWTQLTLCWAPTNDQAIDIAHRVWPTSAVPGQLSQDLPTPEHFVQATKIVTRDMVAESFPCGPDLAPIVDAVRKASENGFDHVYLHQIGPDQEGFLRAWDNELRDALHELRAQPVPA